MAGGDYGVVVWTSRRQDLGLYRRDVSANKKGPGRSRARGLASLSAGKSRPAAIDDNAMQQMSPSL